MKIDWMVYIGSTLHLVTVAFLTVYRDDPLSKIASWVGGVNLRFIGKPY